MVIAYLLISVNSGYEMGVAKKLMEFNEVNDVHLIYREYNIIAEINMSLNKLQEFLIEKIRNIKGVRYTSTLLTTDSI